MDSHDSGAADEGTPGLEDIKNVYLPPDAYFVVEDGPGGPDPEENFEDIRHEFGPAERLAWTKDQTDVTHDETVAILDRFECDETQFTSPTSPPPAMTGRFSP